MDNLLARARAGARAACGARSGAAGGYPGAQRPRRSSRGVSADDGTLVVRLPRDGDHRRALSEHLIHAGFVPVRIEEKSTSLEEAFITITQENIERLARGGRT